MIYHKGDKHTRWTTLEAGEHHFKGGCIIIDRRHQIKETRTWSGDAWTDCTLLRDTLEPVPTHWERFKAWLSGSPLPRARVVRK